jgi:hypothetical protein
MKFVQIFFNKIIIQLFLLIIIINFFSCSENPNGPGEFSFAPPRYNWNIDTLYSNVYNVVVVDTNSYYSLSNWFYPSLLGYYNNGTITEYNTGFYATTISGTDENNIYIAGGNFVNENFAYPVLKIFRNGNFFPVDVKGDTLINNYIFCLNIINNDVWIGTMRGQVMKFNNNHVDYYTLDTSYHVFLISNDILNNLFTFMSKDIYDSNHIPIRSDYRIYKMENNIWKLICKFTDDKLFWPYKGIENRIFVSRYINTYITYEFINGNFTKILDERNTGIYCVWSGGKSFNDMIIFGIPVNYSNINDAVFLHHWNGFWASNELNNDEFLHDNWPCQFQKKFDRYYLVFSFPNQHSLLLKGIQKK